MKILHVAESSRGGCGTYLNELVPLQIDEFGADNIRVVAPDRHLSQLRHVAPGTIRSFRRPGRAVGLAFLVVKLFATIRNFRPDVIHAHSTFAGAVARILAIFMSRRPPVIYCPHGWVFDTAQSRNARRCMESIERVLSRWCAAIVCISNAEKVTGESAGIRPEKIVVIENGLRSSLSAKIVADWDDRRLKILFVGRLDRQKGVDVLLRAVQGLDERVAVRIVGEAVLSNNELPRNSRTVEYLGWLDQENVASQMRACDVVVMPSRWEGFGLVAIEAMRLGKPVIASAVGGLAEIVVDGVTGRLVPVDNPRILREVLLSDAAETRAQMGEAGRKRFVAFYSIDRTHSQLKSLYEAAVSVGRSESAIDFSTSNAGKTSVHVKTPDSVDRIRSV